MKSKTVSYNLHSVPRDAWDSWKSTLPRDGRTVNDHLIVLIKKNGRPPA